MTDAQPMFPWTKVRGAVLDLVMTGQVETTAVEEDDHPTFTFRFRNATGDNVIHDWGTLAPLTELWEAGLITARLPDGYMQGPRLPVEITKAGYFMIELWKKAA
jgi:hypothetical protein